MPTKNTTLPAGIEIFKAGRHIDDTGTVRQFSEADIAGMVSSYDRTLREAPLTIGHPADNLPAYGFVDGLSRNDSGGLTMNTRAVEPQFAEMVRVERFSKRSAAFYPPAHPSNPKPGNWYLRHVAFLGAQPPAIVGLKDIPAFAEGGAAGIVNFSEALNPPENDMDKELQAQLEAANKLAAEQKLAIETAQAATKAAEAQLAQFAEQARTQRNAGHVSFAEEAFKAGKLLPADKAPFVAVANLLADSQPVQFSEGGTTKTQAPVEWLKSLITNAKPLVQFGEHAPGTVAVAGQATKDMSDAEVDKLARAWMAANKTANYAEAVSAVTASFTTAL